LAFDLAAFLLPRRRGWFGLDFHDVVHWGGTVSVVFIVRRRVAIEQRTDAKIELIRFQPNDKVQVAPTRVERNEVNVDDIAGSVYLGGPCHSSSAVGELVQEQLLLVDHGMARSHHQQPPLRSPLNWIHVTGCHVGMVLEGDSKDHLRRAISFHLRDHTTRPTQMRTTTNVLYPTVR
jgi:hypothetical protein